MGDRGRGVVSVHESNGLHLRTLRLNNKPWCMAIGVNDSVLVGDYIIGELIKRGFFFLFLLIYEDLDHHDSCTKNLDRFFQLFEWFFWTNLYEAEI